MRADKTLINRSGFLEDRVSAKDSDTSQRIALKDSPELRSWRKGQGWILKSLFMRKCSKRFFSVYRSRPLPSDWKSNNNTSSRTAIAIHIGRRSGPVSAYPRWPNHNHTTALSRMNSIIHRKLKQANAHFDTIFINQKSCASSAKTAGSKVEVLKWINKLIFVRIGNNKKKKKKCQWNWQM